MLRDRRVMRLFYEKPRLHFEAQERCRTVRTEAGQSRPSRAKSGIGWGLKAGDLRRCRPSQEVREQKGLRLRTFFTPLLPRSSYDVAVNCDLESESHPPPQQASSLAHRRRCPGVGKWRRCRELPCQVLGGRFASLRC
jgi:hypothetical protein